MLRSLISIVVNIVYCVALNLTLFTDRAVMPGGEVRQWRHSAIGRLGLSGQSALVYLQLFFTAVSLVTSGMMLFGVKNSTVIKTIQLASTIASTVMFIVVMIAAGFVHAKYG